MQHKKQETIELIMEAIDALNDEFGRAPHKRSLSGKQG